MRCKLVEGTKENLKATVESLGVRGKMDLKPVIATVQDVIDNIRDNGDEALLGYTEKFDGVKLTSAQLRVTEKEIEDLIAERQAARKAKNFARADEIRNILLEKGIVIKDTREGVKWERV